MMSSAPISARYGIIAHVVHLVNRDYQAMCRDYYTLGFCDESEVDTSPIAVDLSAFFENVLDNSVSELNFKSIVDGLGGILFQYPFRVPAYYALIVRALTVLEGLALKTDPTVQLRNKHILNSNFCHSLNKLFVDSVCDCFLVVYIYFHFDYSISFWDVLIRIWLEDCSQMTLQNYGLH